ncbi:MAG: hypothetical protein NXI30_06395 [bacterium]|nr:hypothetical protein [bacterium]
MESGPTRRAEDGGLDPLAVCSLPSGDLDERLAWIQREILPHATASERRPRGRVIELRDAPGLAAKLDHLISLERDCCAGIVFERGETSRPDHLRLEIRGVDPDASVFAVLDPTGRSDATSVRIGKAVGFGAIVSFLVCCVLPLAAGTIFGAAAVAPIASLDAPGPIALGALVGSAAAWRWQAVRSRC